MNNTAFSFLLTILAGGSTMIGMLVIFIKKKNYDSIIVSSLAFAAGVMICVSITDLIPAREPEALHTMLLLQHQCKCQHSEK